MKLVENNNGSLNLEGLSKGEVSHLIDALLELRRDLDEDEYVYPIIYHGHVGLRKTWNDLYASNVGRGDRE